MLRLPQVTLIAVDCINPEIATEALKKSAKSIIFNKKIILSDQKPFNISKDIEFIQIKKLTSHLEYSCFIMNNLTEFIQTDFCLLIQSDGFVHNPQNWSDEFLLYDYIGSPWKNNEIFLPTPENKFRVGNGGFSLRSKKLLNTLSNLKCITNEDLVICHQYRNYLEKEGINFAPLEVAKIFSQEKVCEDLNINVEEDCFGFHGKSFTAFHEKKVRELYFQFYKDSLLSMDQERLLNFLKNEVGVSETHYFGANFKGNLEVQQIPEEYLQLLTFFKNSDIKTYLELGVANGGSFFVNSIFLQNTAKIVHCVDCLAYKDAPHVLQTDKKILSKVNKLKEFFPEKEFHFFNQTTDGFFQENTNKYDCIFIDADHSYEGVIKDYNNSLKFINNQGYLIFHDINNVNTGVAQCWNEVSKNHEVIANFSHPFNKNCGIGIVQVAS